MLLDKSYPRLTSTRLPVYFGEVAVNDLATSIWIYGHHVRWFRYELSGAMQPRMKQYPLRLYNTSSKAAESILSPPLEVVKYE